MIKLSWSGGSGTADTYLASNKQSTFVSFLITLIKYHIDITPVGTKLRWKTAYTINKDYEGIALWSDGSEWFVIQEGIKMQQTYFKPLII